MLYAFTTLEVILIIGLFILFVACVYESGRKSKRLLKEAMPEINFLKNELKDIECVEKRITEDTLSPEERARINEYKNHLRTEANVFWQRLEIYLSNISVASFQDMNEQQRLTFIKELESIRKGLRNNA